MQQYTRIAALTLASVLVLSLAASAWMPSSFASHTSKKASTPSLKALGGQHIPNDESFTIDSLTLGAKIRTKSPIKVEIVEDGEVKGSAEISVDELSKRKYKSLTFEFDPAIEVEGDFDIIVKGKSLTLQKQKDKRDEIPGHYTNGKNTEKASKYDLVLEINSTPLSELRETFTSGTEDPTDEETPTNNKPPTQEGTSLVTVNSKKASDKSELTGMFVVITQGSKTVASGWTPLKDVKLQNGGTYTVTVDKSFDTTAFLEWEDTKSTSNTRTETITKAKTFTAIYSTDGETPTDDDTTTPTPGEELPAGGAGSVTINTRLLDGTAISGYQVQVRDSSGTPIDTKSSPAVFEGLTEGEQYRAVVYWFGDTFFRHWTDGGLHRYHTFTPSSSGKVFTAEYEHIPSSQQAKLTVIAKTTDGQTIGGTTGRAEDLTLHAESGMEIQVAPPGSLTPYTAGFSGGSEIPFTLVKGQIYTVIAQEFGQYQFVKWEDNDSVNQARAVSMSGDTTLTAIYEIVP